MPGAVPMRFAVGGIGLRLSYTPVEPIIAGQLVEARVLGTMSGQRACGVAAALSVTVAGVAEYDVVASTPGVSVQAPVVGAENGLTVLSYGIMQVTFNAAGTPGGPLVLAAGGQVTPAGAAPDARTVVGYSLAATAAGAVGPAFIKPSGG